jgi:hypothetical protein
MFAELILISELLFNVPHTKATATPTATTTTETPTTTTTAATYPVTIYEATGQELTNWWLDALDGIPITSLPPLARGGVR